MFIEYLLRERQVEDEETGDMKYPHSHELVGFFTDWATTHFRSLTISKDPEKLGTFWVEFRDKDWSFSTMEATAGMVAGSYKRNELVRIRHDSSDSGVSCLFDAYISLLRFFILEKKDH